MAHRKPCVFALVAFLCFYIISETTSDGYSGFNSGSGYGNLGGTGYGGGGGGGGSGYGGSSGKGGNILVQQEKSVDDLGFYDVNILRYSKGVNVVASLVEISFFLLLAAGLVRKIATIHKEEEEPAAEST